MGVGFRQTEQQAVASLNAAIDRKDINELMRAIAEAQNLGLDHPKLHQACQLLAQLEEEEQRRQVQRGRKVTGNERGKQRCTHTLPFTYSHSFINSFNRSAHPSLPLSRYNRASFQFLIYLRTRTVLWTRISLTHRRMETSTPSLIS